MDYLNQAREFFKNDLFATKQAGIVIDEVDINHAKCSMAITPEHYNAAGAVMGGAIYTLCDFTFGVAANAGNPVTVTLSSNINFLSAARTDKLICEASVIKSGRSTCVFETKVYDESGKLIASATMTGFRKA